MRLLARLTTLLTVVFIVAGPALAEEGDRTLRFGIQNNAPTGDYEPNPSIEAQQTVGPTQIGSDRFGSARLGLAQPGLSRPGLARLYQFVASCSGGMAHA